MILFNVFFFNLSLNIKLTNIAIHLNLDRRQIDGRRSTKRTVRAPNNKLIELDSSDNE